MSRDGFGFEFHDCTAETCLRIRRAYGWLVETPSAPRPIHGSKIKRLPKEVKRARKTFNSPRSCVPPRSVTCSRYNLASCTRAFSPTKPLLALFNRATLASRRNEQPGHLWGHF